MKQIISFFTIVIFISCSKKDGQELHGSYSTIDSTTFVFSRINFHPKNIYSFYSSSCFYQNRDSGKYFLDKGTISFKSFSLRPEDTSRNEGKILTNYIFNYQKDTIFYFRKYVSPENKIYVDTTFWVNDSILRK